MAGTKNTHPHPPHTRATPKNTGHPNTRATRRRATRTHGTYPITRAGCGS
jgi:hypothetical protein